MKVNLASQIAFEDGIVAIPELQRLKKEVASVIDSFDSELQGGTH